MSLSESDLADQSDRYLRWREQRLIRQQNYQPTVVELSPTLNTSQDRQNLVTICDQVRDFGFAVYQWSSESGDHNRDLLGLHRQLALTTFDQNVVQQNGGLSLLTDLSDSDQGRFIPYTPRAMGWHTDGYYNPVEQTVKSFTLHCKQPAHNGGALALLDDQLLLISIIDTAPELISLLLAPDAMTIPGNTDELGHNRPDSSCAVFSVTSDGQLSTRYTTRTRHIHWRSEDTQQAADTIKQRIEQRPDLHTTVLLTKNQGLITRNILHRREAYTDNPDTPRQMLRGRYLQLPQPAADDAVQITGAH